MPQVRRQEQGPHQAHSLSLAQPRQGLPAVSEVVPKVR